MFKRKYIYLIAIILCLLLISGCEKKENSNSFYDVNNYFEIEPVFVTTSRGLDIGFEIKPKKNFKEIDVEFTILYDFQTKSIETGESKTKNLKLKVQICDDNPKASYRVQENLSRIPKSEDYSYFHDIYITGYEIEKINVKGDITINKPETEIIFLDIKIAMLIIFIVVFIRPPLAIACFFIAKKKHKNKVLWLVMGIIFGLIALILIALKEYDKNLICYDKYEKDQKIDSYINKLIKTLKDQKDLFDQGKINENQYLSIREEIANEIITLKQQKEKL